jgi:hypothetical protein
VIIKPRTNVTDCVWSDWVDEKIAPWQEIAKWCKSRDHMTCFSPWAEPDPPNAHTNKITKRQRLVRPSTTREKGKAEPKFRCIACKAIEAQIPTDPQLDESPRIPPSAPPSIPSNLSTYRRPPSPLAYRIHRFHMSRSDQAHLSRRLLADIEGINDVLSKLKEFVATAEFDKGKLENTEHCVDKKLPTYAGPVLTKLGFKAVVCLALKSK